MKRFFLTLLPCVALLGCTAPRHSAAQRSVDRELIIAAFRLETEEVQRLLTVGANVNARFGIDCKETFANKWDLGWPCGSDRWTPLLAALNSYTYPDPDSKVENTPESLAAAREKRKQIPASVVKERDSRRIAIVQALLHAGADINMDDGYGATPLYEALAKNYDEIAWLIMDRNPEVNTRTGIYIDLPAGFTPLYEAVDNPELLKELIERGADLNAQCCHGDTPLILALSQRHTNSASILLAAGASIPKNERVVISLFEDAIQGWRSNTPEEERLPNIAWLVSLGLDVNARNDLGETPLLMAASSLSSPVKAFKMLLDAGAHVNAQNEWGDNALHKALEFDEPDVDAVRLLLNNGISVTATNAFGETGYVELMRRIEDEDFSSESSEGNEPNTLLVLAELLLDAGADKWENYMGAPFTVDPNPPSHGNPIVEKLSDPALRNEAFRTILSWQKYRSRPPYPERVCTPLRHVVVCPQAAGPPIYAVFTWSKRGDQRAAPKGHFMLIDADGAMISYYHGMNLLDDTSEFKDINGDSIIDEIFMHSCGRENVLHVLPVTREQTPALIIQLIKEDDKTAWSWRLAPTAQSDVFAIELGPIDQKTTQVTPMVRYVWSATERDYVGPAGGDDLPFKRLHGGGTSPE